MTLDTYVTLWDATHCKNATFYLQDDISFTEREVEANVGLDYFIIEIMMLQKKD